MIVVKLHATETVCLLLSSCLHLQQLFLATHKGASVPLLGPKPRPRTRTLSVFEINTLPMTISVVSKPMEEVFFIFHVLMLKILCLCTLCPEKSKPNTMYHRNVKSECILCKFCVLYSEVFCEICTKFTKIIYCAFSVWFHITFTCCCFTLFPPLYVFVLVWF